MPRSKFRLKSKASLTLGLGVSMFAYASVSASQPALSVDLHDATAIACADGVAPDSGPTLKCAPGYYYCWSNAQQKAVCTTRNCYGTQPQPKPPAPR